MVEAVNQSPETVLVLRNITKLYAGTIALENVNLEVRQGEVHGIIGKNGAGKSTLVDIISGIIPPSKGEIVVKGVSYSSLTPISAKKLKISIITQEPQVIEESTVSENFFMPEYLGGKQMIDWRALGQEARRILDSANFPIDVTLKVRDLSISERQLLLVIKACFVEDADIIIMDEVSASLTPKDQQILYGIIKNRIAAGKTVIFISHHTEELLRVCDRVTVLCNGHSTTSANCADLDLKGLAALIVGNTDYDATVMADKTEQVGKEITFELKDFTNYGKFEHIDLALHKGEIVGLAGLRGSGRTEIFKSIVGLDTHDGGTIYVEGQEKNYRSPVAAAGDGVVYMAEEREAEGLVSIASIKKNLTISILPSLGRKGIIDGGKEAACADTLIQTLDIKAFSRDQEVNQLSGGNKQKVLVGKVMALAPRVCLLDEPTRGVDIEAKESILNTINEEMRKASSILITSPGVEDLIKICDRILVVYGGRIIEAFLRREFSEQDIYRAMQGETIHSGGVVSN